MIRSKAIIFILMMAVVVSISTVFSSGQQEAEAALDGNVVTPADIPREFFPGLDNPGVKPEKKYFIAFSNGEMGNGWCRTFFNDMVSTGEKYAEEFGIRFEHTNAGNNSTKQLSDVQTLLAKQPDLLILSPNEAEPLSVVVDWCNKAGVPLITVDKQLATPPGEGMYIASIQMDAYLNGIANGISIVKTLTTKFGEPKGDIVELAGILGASVSQYRSLGMNRVFADYPNVNIVVSRPGEWDPKISYTAAQDILTNFPAGSVEGVANSCDESGLSFMEAQKAAGRNELEGMHWGCDATVAFLEKILEGKAVETNEYTPYYAIHTFEYAVQYLNGVTIPRIVVVPQRDFSAETPEKRAKLQEIVDKCRTNELEFVPFTYGGFDVFQPDPEMLAKYYKPGDIFYNTEEYTVGKKPYIESPSTIR